MEKGIYTVEMFSKRNASLAKEIKQLRTSEADLLRQQSEGDEKKRTSSQLIPTAQHILEHYSLLSVEEKNRLWKLVLKKATVYRTQDDELMIHISESSAIRRSLWAGKTTFYPKFHKLYRRKPLDLL